MVAFARSFVGVKHDESGQGLLEYLLIIVFIGLVAGAGLISVAGYVNQIFSLIVAFLTSHVA